MEFLRFGSSIPGGYWGCCVCCIIQNFKMDPDEKASIELVSGDGGGTLGKFAGPTYRDIFEQRLRIGTFSTRDMPNHAFLAILTEWQINSGVGKKWLAILREYGFEFIRTVNNSVYSGDSLASAPVNTANNNDNHIFGLFRNIGSQAIKDPFTPPVAWSSLPEVKTTPALPADPVALAKEQFDQDMAIWAGKPVKPLLTEAEVVAAGAPVIMAGLRSQYPPQSKADREEAKTKNGVKVETSLKAMTKLA